MKYTPVQKKLMKDLGMCKVKYKNMWKSRGELGYSSKGRGFYEISIANDFPNKEVKDIVLLHELGHEYYGHLDLNSKLEVKAVHKMFKELEVDYSRIREYGGPMTFLNIVMDFQINTSLLTLGNIKTMKLNGVEPMVPEVYKLDVMDDFRDYYRPLIERLKNDANPLTEEEKEQVEKAIKKMQEDLPSSVNPFDGDLDDEISKELTEEGYMGGEAKDGKTNPVKETTVNEILKSEGMSKGDAPTEEQISVVDNSCDTISKFLKSILNVSTSVKSDAIRRWNNGSRRNPNGILYSVPRQKTSVNKKKLGILIDVSGSMETESIIKGISSIKGMSNILNKDSSVVTWTTRKVEEYKIKDTPEYLNIGGGTRMDTGLKYLIENKFTDIVIYSDFETDMEDLLREANSTKANIYSIVVTCNGEAPYARYTSGYGDYIKRNKKVIYVK